MAVKGLKIRCPKGRAGSTPALVTTLTLPVIEVTHRLCDGRVEMRNFETLGRHLTSRCAA